MRTTKRGTKIAALAVGLALVAASCGSDEDSKTTTPESTTATTAADGATTTEASTPTSEASDTTVGDTTEDTSEATTPGTGTEDSGDAAGMVLTIDLNPDAVWDDGSPITFADVKCTFDATLNTPGSLSTVGYDQITSLEEGTSDKQVVATFKTVYAPYKNLFSNLIKAEAFDDCNDVSADMQDSIPFSGREWKMESWSPDQEVLVPNENYWGPEKPIAKKVVMVPKADSDTEIASLVAGEVDFIFPQAFSGITEALNNPNIKFTPGYGTNYEALWFQQQDGPFADPAFRQGFAHSIDRDLILKTIYDPIFPGAPLLDCGVWVPNIGKWCDDSIFKGFFDLKVADTFLTEGGYEKNSDGMWAKDGKVPEIRWVVNAGNSRRESTQALMIPEFKKQGFNVVSDNCDAACYFQQRLPALDYDLAMYIQTAAPDPTVTTILSCDSIPSEANGNAGQNTAGWCNEDASKLMLEADKELDEGKRIDLTHQIGAYLAKDAVMVSLFQFPNIAAWRTDKLSGPVDADASNYQAFQNIYEWTPTASDGSLLIGAEQWPDCINTITECANSSWMVWTTSFKVLPSVWDTTSDGGYEMTALVSKEPTVELL